jgi:hypothetical protein
MPRRDERWFAGVTRLRHDAGISPAGRAGRCGWGCVAGSLRAAERKQTCGAEADLADPARQAGLGLAS